MKVVGQAHRETDSVFGKAIAHIQDNHKTRTDIMDITSIDAVGSVGTTWTMHQATRSS